MSSDTVIVMIEVAQFQPPEAQSRYADWRDQHSTVLDEIPPESIRIDTGRATAGGTYVNVSVEEAQVGVLFPTDSRLSRYWIEFAWPKREGTPFGTEDHSFGVTAHGYEDALRLIREQFFDAFSVAGRPKPEPPVRRVVENIDVPTLPDHVRSGMRPPNWRGVWFPTMGPLS